MADFVSNLIDMGFDSVLAKKAVDVTGNIGVEAAMEWLLANPEDKPGTSSSATSATLTLNTAATTEDAKTSTTEEVAAFGAPQSYKCEDCGKIFTNMETVEYHAAKTNHSNFSESTEEKKPLTAEEKATQQALLVELMKQKRAERVAREQREEHEREKCRVASGKELLEAKRRMQDQEMKEIAEFRRREKLDDKQARDRVKAQIEADKNARKAKLAALAASTDRDSASAVPTPVPSVKPSVAEVTPGEKKEYTQTKIQMRLPNGSTLVQTFGVQEPLAAVRLYAELHRTDGATGPFNLRSTFPNRVYTGDDYDTPLASLGLVPSAVVMITKGV